MKFSLIIPVYNLEPYIAKCLKSVVNQDLGTDSYEIIVINDGSMDNSEKIIKHYAEKYANIHLHTIKNNGVSNARNEGLQKAKGEYVFFIDGDDWLNPNILKSTYENLKTDTLDIARFGHTREYASKPSKTVSIPESKVYANGLDFIMETKTNDYYPWQFVFSKQFLIENKLWFNTNLSFCEDKELVIRALTRSKRFKNFKTILYNYNLKRENAASFNISDKGINDLVAANRLIYNFANVHIKNTEHSQYFKNDALTSIRNSYYILTTNSLWKRFKPWSKMVKNKIDLINIDTNDKLHLLKKSSFVFYLKYYLPRAMYHKINSK